MAVSVLGTANRADWLSVLELFQVRDINFSPDYHRVYERAGNGRAFGFLYSEGADRLFFPSFIRPIETVAGQAVDFGWTDVESIPGHTGPLSTSSAPEFLAGAWKAYFDWCDSQHVVCEFTRFNLYMTTQSVIHHSWTLSHRADAVTLSLPGSPAELWKAYTSIQRNMVRKAERAGLEFLALDFWRDHAEFLRLYSRTMDRVGARASAYYPEVYYEALKAELGECIKVWGVFDGSELVAASMFLVDDERIYYHLSGSDESRRSAAPNNYLLHCVALWGVEHGRKAFFLGGGGDNPAIFRFKGSISRERLPQIIGRRIQDADKLARLNEIWLRRHGEAVLPEYTFPYRL